LSIGEDFLKNPPFPTSMLEYGESLKKTYLPRLIEVGKGDFFNLPLCSRLIEVGKGGFFLIFPYAQD
jgi:hypothetical protein